MNDVNMLNFTDVSPIFAMQTTMIKNCILHYLILNGKSLIGSLVFTILLHPYIGDRGPVRDFYTRCTGLRLLFLIKCLAGMY